MPIATDDRGNVMRAFGMHICSRSPLEEGWLLVENKYTAIAAVGGFMLMLWLTDGSMIAAFGVLALIAGTGWAIRRLLS